MRLLHVAAGIDPGWGGPSKVLRELAQALAHRGHTVDVLATDAAPGGRRAPVPLGAPVHDEGGYRLFYKPCLVQRPPYPAPAHTLHLVRTAATYDVVTVHSLFNQPATSALVALRHLPVPFVVRPAGMLDPYGLAQRAGVKRWWLRLLEGPSLGHASRILVSTPHEQQAVDSLGLGTPTALCPQGVALDSADPAESAVPPVIAELAPGQRVVLFLSRVATKKGLPRLVDAFAALTADPTYTDVALVIAGPDERGHRAEVEAHVARHGGPVAARVHFTGEVRGAAKRALFERAAVYALTSDDENFGVAVVEAAGHGAPVLVTDAVGLAPDVAATGAGRAVPRDVPAITAALRALLDAGREPFAEATRAFAARYSWDEAAARYEAMYLDVLREADRVPRP